MITDELERLFEVFQRRFRLAFLVISKRDSKVSFGQAAPETCAAALNFFTAGLSDSLLTEGIPWHLPRTTN